MCGYVLYMQTSKYCHGRSRIGLQYLLAASVFTIVEDVKSTSYCTLQHPKVAAVNHYRQLERAFMGALLRGSRLIGGPVQRNDVACHTSFCNHET